MAKNGKVLSIDITNESITIIEITASAKKQTYIHNVIIFETPEDSYEDGIIREPEKIANAIREQLTQRGISNRNAIFVLSSSKIVNREVVIPFVKENKVRGIINANSSEYFPVNIEDYIVSHTVLESVTDDEGNKQLRVLAVAAPQNMVRAYYDLGKLAGLNIVGLDYIGNAMLQLIKTQANANATTMVVQLGSESTVLNIVQGENLLLQRTVPYGTNSVVNVVMDDKGVDATTAMTLLQNDRMITVDFDDNEATGAFRYLINNIGRVMDFYATKNQDKPIEDILLTGDGALIKGIDGLFKVQLNVETRIMDNLYNIKFDPSIDQKVYNPVYLVTPIGAAFAPMGFELGDVGGVSAKSGGPGLGLYVGIFAVCAIGAAAMAFYSIKAKQDAEDKRDQVQADINKIADIEQIITDWEDARAVYVDAYSMSASTYHLNENCKMFIDELESKIPSSVYITGFSSSDSGITIPCVGTSYDDVEKFIMQLKTIECLDPATVNVSSLTKQIDSGTNEETFVFSVSANYIPSTVTPELESELEPAADSSAESEDTSAEDTESEE